MALGLVAVVGSVAAEGPRGPLLFEGTLFHDDDLSAVACVGTLLFVAADEGAELQVLEPTGEPSAYRVRPDAIRLASGDGELDIEALALSGSDLYVLGSHSFKRRLLDPADDRARNRERLAAVSEEPRRQRLYRLRLDLESGRPTAPPEWISLRPAIERDRVLGPFAGIPAEENGANLEGLAADGGALYVGFRSPVLREGLVPVLRTGWGKSAASELLFLDLGGRGIRSLERVDGGFLVLARREHCDGDSEAIYFWDGGDGTPGTGARPGHLVRLLDLDPPPGATTEGMCVAAEHDDHWEVVVVHDGLSGGHPLRLRVERNHPAR
jgi:hypothetical protein